MAETTSISPEQNVNADFASLMLAFEGIAASTRQPERLAITERDDDPIVKDIFGDTEVPISVREKFRGVVEKGGKVGMDTAKWLANKKTWILAGGSASELIQSGQTEQLEYWLDYLVDYYT